MNFKPAIAPVLFCLAVCSSALFLALYEPTRSPPLPRFDRDTAQLIHRLQHAERTRRLTDLKIQLQHYVTETTDWPSNRRWRAAVQKLLDLLHREDAAGEVFRERQ